MITVHVASEPIDDVQKCARCGFVLTDNRDTVSPDGRGKTYWNAGMNIAVENLQGGVTHSGLAWQSEVEKYSCTEVTQ